MSILMAIVSLILTNITLAKESNYPLVLAIALLSSLISIIIAIISMKKGKCRKILCFTIIIINVYPVYQAVIRM